MNETMERERAAEILRIGELHGVEHLARDSIVQGHSPAAFRRRLLDVEPSKTATQLGMSRGEIARYSLAAALSAIATGSIQKSSFEAEISAELAKRHGEPTTANALLIPPDVLQRDLNVATAGAGGFLVETVNSAGWIEAARPRSAVMSLGSQVLEGLTGSVTIPRILTGASDNWLATESGQAGESTPALGQLALTPKTVSSYVEFSRQLLLQSSTAVEQVIQSDLLAAIAAAIDLRAFQGSGASGQPLGIIATPGVGSQSGTSLNIAGVLAMQANSGIAESQFTSGGFATTAAVAQTLAARIATGSSSFLWQGNLRDGMMSGFPARTSSHAGTANLVFGDFAQLIVASWGVLQIDFDPFTKFTSAIIGARILHSVDVGLRYPAAFTVASSVT